MKEEQEKKKRGRPKKETASTKETALSKETAAGKETVPVKHKYSRRGNPAMTGEAIQLDENDNAAYLSQGLKLLNLPNIDLHDPVAVQNRINEYFTIVFEHGHKPTVAGLGLALNGLDRIRLWEIRTGKFNNTKGEITTLPQSVVDIIRKTYKLMEELWENYMQNGKINPVSGIFLGKNNYGYQDKTEYVLTPNSQSANDLNEKQLLERYGIDSDSDS